MFASEGAPPVSTTIMANLPPVSMTPAANFATSTTGVVDTSGKFAPVSTIPPANFTPVSMTPVANCCWYQQHRRQKMGTVSDYWHFKVNLKNKNFIYVDLTTQRCSKKITNFLIEDFFDLPQVSTTLTVNLELRISPRIFEKNQNALMGYSGAWRKLIYEKKLKSKISWHCFFRLPQVHFHFTCDNKSDNKVVF